MSSLVRLAESPWYNATVTNYPKAVKQVHLKFSVDHSQLSNQDTIDVISSLFTEAGETLRYLTCDETYDRKSRLGNFITL